MANISMRITQAYLDQRKVNYDVIKEFENALMIHVRTEMVQQVNVFVMFEEDGSSCRIQTYHFLSIPKERKEEMLKICNELNNEYSFVKFVVSETDDGELYLSLNDDAVLQPENCGEEVMRCIGQILGVIDLSYPAIMKTLYA